MIIADANVNSQMSSVPEAVLYASPIFIPNVTFTDRYQIGGAGEYLVPKFNGTGKTEPKAPGSNFVGTNYKNTTTAIRLINNFNKEYDIRGVVANAVPYDVYADAVINLTEEQRTGWEATGLAVLTAQGTVSTDTGAITVANVKSKLISARKALRKKHANPNVVLCSVDTYSTILESAGADFVPMFNDDVIRSGHIGMWLGMYIIEATLLDNASSYKYVNDSSVVTTQSIADVDFIMYDFNAFSIVDLLTTLRLIDTEDFVGSKAQSDITSGYKVTCADAVAIKKTIASTEDDDETVGA